MSIKKSSLGLFLLRIIKMAFTLFVLILTANFFGVSLEKDIWLLVTTVLSTVCSAVWGPMNETFRTKFVFIKEKYGEEKALQQTSSLLFYMILITLFLSLLIIILQAPIASLMLSSPTENGTNLFCRILLIMVPSILITQMSTIGISILNSYNVFYLPELVGTLTSCVNILILILLAPVLGIYSLCISQYINITLLLLAIIYYLKRKKIHFKIKTIHIKDCLPFLLFSLPFFFPYFTGQLNNFAEKYLCSHLGEGIVSSLDYARYFSVTVQSVLSSVITTIAVPFMAKMFANDDVREYNKIFIDNCSIIFILLCLILPPLFGDSTILCKIMFLHGNMSEAEIPLISELVKYYAISVIGVIFYLISGYSLLTIDKGKFYALTGVCVQLFVLITNVLLISNLGIYILPISLFLFHLVGGLVMFFYNSFLNKKLVLMKLFKFIIPLVIMMVANYYLNSYFTFNTLINLMVNIFVILFLLFLSLPLLDVKCLDIKRKLFKK